MESDMADQPQWRIDPNDDLDFKFDFAGATNGTWDSDWLDDGETISAHVITADSGITIHDTSVTDDGTSVTFWAKLGTAGQDYRVHCKITTSLSRVRKVSRLLYCREA